MKIRLAIIPPDAVAGIMRLAGDLRSAVNAGDMDGVDAATKKLMAVTANSRAVEVSEEEWRRFLAEVRTRNATFQSDYVVPGQLCSQFFPEVTAETMVLQFPFTEREGDDV